MVVTGLTFGTRSLIQSWAIGALAVILAFVASAGAQEIEFPQLTGRVVDVATILSAKTEARITDLSAVHESRTTNQVVVATLPSLQGRTIEEYANRLFRHWGIGQKDKNNGVLLLVAPNDRKVRIEVGYGLEATLTDALARAIIEQNILPAFRAGDLQRGVVDGVTSIIRASGGNPEIGVTRPTGDHSVRDSNRRWEDHPILSPFLFVLMTILFTWVFARMDRHPGGTGGGRYTGWSSGSGYSGGGFSGGGSSGGGFSGGGGSSGGGGASGSW